MDNKEIVLIADDNYMIRSLTKDYLGVLFPGKYNLEEFKDGNELDARLKKSLDKIALVFSDNNMGDRSPTGLDILKKYDVPAVLAIDVLTKEIKAEIEKYNIVFFPKRYKGRILKEAIDQALNNSKRIVSV